MNELGRTVAMQQSGDAKGALAMVQTNLGKNAMDAIRGEVNALHADAEANLSNVLTNSQSVWTWAVVYGLAAAATLLSGMAVSYTHLDVYKRQESVVAISFRRSVGTPQASAATRIASIILTALAFPVPAISLSLIHI